MTTTTTQTIELGKAQFWTIEAFYFELEDGYYYEEERCEDLDTYWFPQMGGTLEQYFNDQCNNNLGPDDLVRVSRIPRDGRRLRTVSHPITVMIVWVVRITSGMVQNSSRRRSILTT